MKQYVLTQEQYDSLLKELELEMRKGPDQFSDKAYPEIYQDALNGAHRRFHCIVCKWLD
mgnify:FL=1